MYHTHGVVNVVVVEVIWVEGDAVKPFQQSKTMFFVPLGTDHA